MKISRGIFIFALVALAPTLACAKQIPPTPPAPASPVALAGPHSPIGTGLDGLVYWSTEFPFNDVFKTSGEWMSGTADNWDDHRPLDLDAHGWVRSLRPKQWAVTLMMWGSQMWVGGTHRAPAGRYTVEYEGEGTIEYGHARVVETAPGRDVIELAPEPPDGGLPLIITSTNPKNYIRNIRVLLPGAVAGETFNPAFLESLRGYKVIRFLGWMTGPSAEDVDRAPHVWSHRPRIENARWGSEQGGAPIEVIVDLCNRLHVDPWFNIHHLAGDDFVRSFAEAVRGSLDADRKVYVEHSNEVWNPSFSSHAYAEKRGVELGLSTESYDASKRYNSRRTRELGKIFREVLGRDKVVVVLSTQADVPSISEDMLSWDHTDADVDALATAPYFGYELGLPDSAAQVSAMTLDDLFRELETKTVPATIAAIAEQAEIARRHKVRLITYEAGQHLIYDMDNFNLRLDDPRTVRINALFDAANHDPRMGRLYTRLITEWNTLSGGGLFVHLMNCGQAGPSGRWGLIEYQGQPRSEAPRSDAIRKWMEAR